MLAQTLIFLITTVGDLFVLALLLRFMLQWLRAPARNQLSEFLAALTDFIVRPARRVIPGWWGLDLATLVLAWLVAAVQLWLVLQIKGYELGSAVGVALAALAALAVIDIARLTIYVVMFAVILQAVLSWVSPYSAPRSAARQRYAPLSAAVSEAGADDRQRRSVAVVRR